MRRTYAGPFSRFAIDTDFRTGIAEVWDAERGDPCGRATLVYTAPSVADALAWAHEQTPLETEPANEGS